MVTQSLDWLDELQLEGRLLYDAVRSGFPDLERTPTSDADVADNVRSSVAWGRNVKTGVGIAQRQRRYGGKGILPLLDANSKGVRGSAGMVSVLGPLPLLDTTQFDYFEYAFSVGEEAYSGASQSLTSAVSVKVVAARTVCITPRPSLLVCGRG